MHVGYVSSLGFPCAAGWLDGACCGSHTVSQGDHVKTICCCTSASRELNGKSNSMTVFMFSLDQLSRWFPWYLSKIRLQSPQRGNHYILLKNDINFMYNRNNTNMWLSNLVYIFMIWVMYVWARKSLQKCNHLTCGQALMEGKERASVLSVSKNVRIFFVVITALPDFCFTAAEMTNNSIFPYRNVPGYLWFYHTILKYMCILHHLGF